MPAADKTLEAWTHYWRSGNLATCFMGEAAPKNEFDLSQFWTAFFSTFGENTVLLDICTGNGAVARLAAETAVRRGKTCWVHGVDSAKIAPRTDLPNAPAALKGVRFWPGVRIEDLPFEDGAFDGISGQYALEYTDRIRSIPEVARVLRAGGRICLLMHTRNSEVVRASGATLNDLNFMFEELRIFRAAQAAFTRLYPADGELPERSKMKKKHRAALEDFENRLVRLSELAAREDRTVLKFIADRLGTLYSHHRRYRKADAIRFISSLEQEMRFYRLRMKSICQAALDEQDVRDVTTAFAGHGLILEEPGPVTVSPGERLVGWHVSGRRPGAPEEP